MYRLNVSFMLDEMTQDREPRRRCGITVISGAKKKAQSAQWPGAVGRPESYGTTVVLM